MTTALYWPMAVQAFLTFAVYPILLMRRGAAARSGTAPWERTANGYDEPPPAYRAARNISNQYELPVLFHIACLALIETGGSGAVSLALAWLFALSRLVHAGVHLGPNILKLRGAVFGLGYLAVIGLWLALVLRLFTPPV